MILIAPAKIASFQRVAGIGIGRFRPALGDLLGTRIFRDAHQDLRQIQLLLHRCQAVLSSQVIIYFGLGNLQLAFNFVLTHTLHHDFVAD